MNGKTVLITGASAGIGAETAKQLAARGATVFFACRSAERAEEVMRHVRNETGNGDLHFLQLNLEDLDDVQRAASDFLAFGRPLDVLILNAGVAGHRGVSAQGFERTFAVNHLGHMLLTLLLQPALVAASSSRVVVVASKAHEHLKRLSLERVRQPAATPVGLFEYEHSKLANMLFAKELSERWRSDGVRVFAVHPGTVASDIWRRIPLPIRWLATRWMATVEEGALASVTCATASLDSGGYFERDGQRRTPSPLVNDASARAALWAQSVEWLAPWLDASKRNEPRPREEERGPNLKSRTA